MLKRIKKNKAYIGLAVIVIVILSGIALIQTGPYSSGFKGSWRMFVYETDNPIQNRELIVGLQVYVDDTNTTDDIEFNILKTDVYMPIDTIAYRNDNEIPGNEAYMSVGDNINMSELHRWHFMVLINLEGDLDFDNPENNFWNGTIHLVDYTNRFLWNDYSSYYPGIEFGYRYGINISHDGYTMDLRFWGF